MSTGQAGVKALAGRLKFRLLWLAMSDLTQLLAAAQQGDARAQEELWTTVYHELRALAARKLAGEREGHTLQPTALVHEVFLRLAGAGSQAPQWQGRGHFFGTAAEAMRRILVESARRKRRLKRGGEQVAEEFDEALLPNPESGEKVLDVHEILDALAAEDPVKAEIVKLRFFVGLKHDEIASLLGVNEKTVRRHWEVAKVWLYRAMRPTGTGEAETK
jgi:RNA polymerase sigma factor (TIGR02999 family)